MMYFQRRPLTLALGAIATATVLSPQPIWSHSFSPSRPAQVQPQNLAQVPPPPLPDTAPEPQTLSTSGIVGRSPDPDIDIGIGYLRPQNLDFLDQPDWPQSPYLEANWLQAIALPIYATPDAEPGDTPWGWLINGWLVVDTYEPILVGRDASFLMLQTHYALFSFPVLEIREDGWFRFQYTPIGTAWAHQDHLNLGEIPLAIETWPDHFLATGWVEFLRHGISQPLRSSSSAADSILALVGPESFIEPLSFDGDWMQVRVTQPTEGCDFFARLSHPIWLDTVAQRPAASVGLASTPGMLSGVIQITSPPADRLGCATRHGKDPVFK
jgi:hypothetical protein